MTEAAQLKPKDLAAVTAVVVIWGMNFVLMKVGLASFTPFQLGAGRFLFACIPLALLVRRPAVRPRWVLGFGAAQGLGQFGLLFVALHVGMTAALASVLLQTQVFFTALLAARLLHEQIKLPLKIGMTFAALGLACFGANVLLSPGGGAVTALGLALTIGASAMWAVSNIIVRKAQQESTGFDAVSFVAWSSSVSVLPFLAMAWWIDPPQARDNWQHAPLQAWLTLAALGWLATNLAYGLWTGLLKKFQASRVAPFSLGVPLIGLTAGIVLLREVVSPLQWLGASFVLCALLSVLFGERLARRRS